MRHAVASKRKSGSLLFVIFWIGGATVSAAQPNPQEPYTPPKQIEEALNIFAGYWGKMHEMGINIRDFYPRVQLNLSLYQISFKINLRKIME